jgi:hypothetical protein
MGSLPFTEQQFFEVFAAYNQAVWPAPIVLTILALGGAALAWRRPGMVDGWIAAFLAGLWMWTGIAYHMIHFSEINPAARAFGALFVIQGGLFLWWGPVRGELTFVRPDGLRGTMAAVVLAYALFVYPLLGILAGQGFMTGPTFGAPCPAVIYTFGMLLLMRSPPLWLLAIPVLWALVGSSAVWAFHVWQDAGLLLSAVLAIVFVVRERRRDGHQLRDATASR